jgi:hypothetical protein
VLGAWVGECPVSITYGGVCQAPGRHWAHGGTGRVAAFGVWRHRVPLGVWQAQALGMGCVGCWGVAVVVVLGTGRVTWQSLGRLDAGRTLMMRGRCCVVRVTWPSLGRIGRQVCGRHWAMFDVGHVGHVVISLSKRRIN